MTDPLLEVCDLRTTFATDGGEVAAVDGVSLSIPRDRTVALVGESGCGKSVTALSIMRLIPQPPGRIAGGRILFTDSPGNAKRRGADGNGASGDDCVDLLKLSGKEMRSIRGNRIAMVFQEPMTSLNPVFSVGEQIVEAIELHQPLRGKAAWSAAVEMLHRVGIAGAAERARDYPHQMSGGMRQRVMIAMALSCRPALLIADEPTTALDVTTQAQILELLRSLQTESGMSVLLITHDLGVVAQHADYVYVMYAGRIVEHAPVAELFADPLHPYTQGLMRCLPVISKSAQRKRRLEVIPGSVQDPSEFPSGCRFHPRCSLSTKLAKEPGRQSVAPDGESATKVLRSCVESCKGEPSGMPELAELMPKHYVACRETNAPIAANSVK